MTQNIQTIEGMQTWLVSLLARQLGLAPESINAAERFSHYGLDSARATALVSEMAAGLGRVLPPTVVWTYPTPQALARYLAGEADSPATPDPDPCIASEPIAIIGMACRFPGAPNPAAFWRMLCAGTDAIREVPAERWDLAALYDADPAAPGKMSTRWGGFLDQVDQFDPQFFGISPREASQVDPQQRLMLELSWEALEDAGVPAERLRGSQVGVFFGAMGSDYARLPGQDIAAIVQHTATGQDTSIIPARVSYAFGFEGPSLAVNTACSSSLVAVHLACQSLRTGESTMALAGGVNLILAPESTVAMSKFGAMAPDGRSRAFDARADGYVRGEGGGVVVLKPLAHALAAGDPIYAVILGSAANNDGFSNGLTAPNPKAQEAVLRQACRRAGVQPSDIAYVEAHGTGTALGDPIEAGALGAVLGAGRPAEQRLLVGSVKTNIGHLEAAAGAAGLIKVALAMRHGQIPPSLHFEQPSPHIPFDELRLKVPQFLGPWPETGNRLLAGVSSFGFGGTNCHVVVEGPPTRAQLVPLSAANPAELQARAAALLEATGTASLGATAAAAARWLSAGPHRLAATCHSSAELRAQLAAAVGGEERPGLAHGQAPVGVPRVVFVLPGQGAHRFGMARRLLAEEPVFRAALERFDAALQRRAGWSALAELTAAQAGPRFNDVEVVQAMLCGLQIALADLWRAWGIEPAAVIGHSMGEIAAAYIAGALSLEEAARVEWARGEALRRLRGSGGMLLAALTSDEAQALLAGYERQAVIAANNGPRTIVLSGDVVVLEALAARLTQRGLFHRRLPVDFASHSPLMEPAAQELEKLLADMPSRAAMLPFYSTVTGGRLDRPAFDGTYWAGNLRQPVRFAEATRQLIDDGYEVFLELSPHPTLTRAVKESFAEARRPGAALASLQHEAEDRAAVLEALGTLYALGAPVDWRRLYPTADVEALPPALAAPVEAGLAGAEPQRADVLVLSARSAEALDALAQATGAQLAEGAAPAAADLCYSASRRRGHLEHRLAVVGRGTSELGARLLGARAEARERGLSRGRAPNGPRPRLAFVFCGQGAQWAGMGRALLDEPTARAALRECDQALRRYADWPLIEALTTEAGQARLNQTEIAQPALAALQIALAVLWQAWGIEPDVVVGHSAGEIAAAYTAGVLTLDEAMRVAFHRGRLMQRAAGQGGMAAVRLSAQEAEALLRPLNGRLSLAAINSPTATVIAGEHEALAALGLKRGQDGIGRLLDVDYAFHSRQMEPHQAELRQALEGVIPRPARRAIVSTVTGRPAAEGDFTAAYWSRGIREPVRFAEAVEVVFGEGCGLFLEIGPHPVLAGAVAECLGQHGEAGTLLASLRREADGRTTLLESLGALYTQGQAVTWSAVYPAGNFVGLPGYPWQRARHWIEPADRARSGAAGSRTEREPAALPLLGRRLRLASQEIIYEAAAASDDPAWLVDHCLGETPLFPAAGFAAMALAAGSARGEQARCVEGLVVSEALALRDGEQILLQTVLSPEDGADGFRIFSSTAAAGEPSAWILHASGRLRAITSAEAGEQITPLPEALTPWPAEAFYQRAQAHGLTYGPQFRRLTQLEVAVGAARAQVDEATPDAGAPGWQISPTLLDACFQVCLAALINRAPDGAALEHYLPMGIDRLAILGQPTGRLRVAATLRAKEASAGIALGDIRVTDEAGRVVVAAVGLLFRPASRELVDRLRGPRISDWLHAIDWQPAPLTSRRARAEAATGWLIVDGGEGPGERLAMGLHGAGDPCQSLRAVNETEVRAALAGLAASAQRRVGVVYVCGSASRAGAEPLPGQFCSDVLALCQILAASDNLRPRLWIVTRSAQNVGAAPGAVAPAQAALWGLGRTIAVEHPELWGGLVDLEAQAPGNEVSLLLNELWEAHPGGETALRGGRRFVARLERTAARAAPPVPLALRPDASYVITGGLGALGLRVAAWMVQRGARHLVLLGRSPASAAALAAIRQLEQAGTRLLVVEGDVACAEDAARALAEAGQLAPLRGLVHAAGVLDDGVLLEQTPERFERVLAPKAAGAWHLHTLTSAIPLDFFVLFSSAAALLGSAGQAGYAAANAYLDALAHARRGQGLPALSVNWAPWTETGMAAAEAGRGVALWASRGVGALAPADGLAALELLLGSEAPQVAVLPPAAKTPTRKEASARPELQALAAAPAAERRRLLEDYLRGQVAEVLKLSRLALDPQQPLNHLGLDSLMAVELRNRLAQDLRLTVPMATFLRGPSVDQLTALLADQYEPAAPERGAASLAPATQHHLTRGQMALWYLYQMSPQSPAYNIGWVARIIGPLDAAALQAALQALVERHPALRSTLAAEGGQAVQRIHERVAIHLPTIDCPAGDETLQPLLDEAFHEPFDLERGPALRLRLFMVSPQEHVLLLAVHHALVDFWSLLVTVDELEQLYLAQASGRPGALPPPARTFADFARWHADLLAGPEGGRLWAYWSRQLGGELPGLILPTDRPRPPAQTFRGHSHSFQLSAELSGRIRTLARAEGVTLHAALLAAFQVLLHRYTGQDDLLIGTLTNGRSRAEFSDIVGYFVNPVALRANCAENPTFRDFMSQTRQTLLDALEHQDFPFAQVVERLQPGHDPSRSPLIQAMFVLQQPQRVPESVPFMLGQAGGQAAWGELRLESIAMPLRQARFDLDLMMYNQAGTLVGFLQYNIDVFDQATIERLVTHFQLLLEGVVADPACRVANLPMQSEAEREQMRARADQQVRLRGRQIDLGHVEAVLARHPAVAQAAAAVWDGAGAGQRLVAYVAPRNATPDGGDAVALQAAQVSQWQSVWDETYTRTPTLPDPTFNTIGWNSSYTGEAIPAEAMREWAADPVEHILTARPKRVLEIGCGSGLLLFQLAPHTEHYVGTDLAQAALDYVGAQLQQHSLPQVQLQRRAADDFAGLEPRSFDAVILNSVIQYFPDAEYLRRVITGAVDLVRPGGMIFIGDVRSLPLLETFQAAVALHLAPAELTRAALRQLVQQRLAQEEELAIDPAFFTQLAAPLARVAQVAVRPRRGRVLSELTQFRYQVVFTLGTPKSEHLEPAWRDWEAERLSLEQVRHLLATTSPAVLALSGVPNARLSSERATMNWLASDAGPDTAGAWREERQRAQRAGLDPADLWALAEQLPYHIELSWARHNAEGAFDALLVRRDQERSARVRWPEAPAGRAAMANDPLRAAYHRHVVPQLRDLLKEHLPEYMRPSAISVLSALPLTPDGHLDRRSLPAPEPEHRDVEQSRVMPRTPLEDVLAGIWASVLGVDQVGVEDNFFELGGHSLLVVQVMARIREAFQVDLPFRSLFETPTVAGLALAMLGQSGQIERRAELLVALARLSDQEVEAMLALDSAALVSAP